MGAAYPASREADVVLRDGSTVHLRPQAVAVIGASRRRETVGGAVFHNLLESALGGVVCTPTSRCASARSTPPKRPR